MSVTAYSKWDNLNVSDDEKEDMVQQKAKAIKTDIVLITTHWDSTSEQIRWSMDRIGFSYKEIEYPWGLHFVKTLTYSDAKQLTYQIPILIKNKEVYKENATKILVFLYSQALFTSSFRMYANADAVDLQEYFDQRLLPAATTLYLSVILSDFNLIEKYILSKPHLNTWNTLQRIAWPILYLLYYKFFKISKENIQQCYKIVDRCFQKVENELVRLGNVNQGYLMGKDFSAADISFASHASLILFANEDDVWAENLMIKCPKLSELPFDVREKVINLRSSIAGKFAIRMYSNERKTCLRNVPSKYAKVNNPWWTHLKPIAILTLPSLLLLSIMILVYIPWILLGTSSLIGTLYIVYWLHKKFHLKKVFNSASRFISLVKKNYNKNL